MQTIKLIVNPASGRKKTAHWIPQIEVQLGDAGMDIDIEYTLGPGDGTRLAAAAVRDGYQRFGVMGGDGTVNEVVNGLVQATSDADPIGPLAIFPAGSGNDLAATLALTTDPQRFAHGIACGETKPIDICSVTIQTAKGQIQRFFVNNLGVGLEAAVAQRYQKIQWVQGHLRYIVAALQMILDYQATTMSAEWAERDFAHLASTHSDSELLDFSPEKMRSQSGKILLVTVGNNRRAGGGFYLTPDAQLDDGLLDAGILGNVSKPHLIKLLAQALQGKHTHDPAITMLRTPTLQITCHEPISIHADGELLAIDALQIEVTVYHKQLQVYA